MKPAKCKRRNSPSVGASEVDALSPKIERAILLLIILMVAVFRINLIDIPYERDEGAYIYFGQMIVQGQTPYHDFYEDKPPANMYFYALMVWIFGPNEGNMHAAFMLLNIATLLLLHALARRLFGAASALCAATAFATLSVSYALSGFSCMSEHIVIFFATAGMALLLGRREEPSSWEHVLAGMVLGLSCWVKQSAIFFLMWGGAAVLLPAYHVRWARRWRHLLWLGAGAAAVSLFFLALMAKLGVFREFWFSAVELPRLFVTTVVAPQFVKGNLALFAGGIFRDNPLVIALAIAGLASLAFTGRPRNEKIGIWLLALLSLLAVVPGLMFYNHYWLQVVPAAALAVGAAIAVSTKAFSRFTGTSARAGALAVLLVFGMGKAWMIAKKRGYYFGNDYTSVLRKTYGLNPFPSSKRIGEYLRNRTQPGERIAILGSEPQIFLYAKCRNATRHAFTTHLVDPRNPYAADWRREYITDVEKTAPNYVVAVNHPASWCCDGNSCKEMFAWAENYLARFYDSVAIADIIPDESRPRLVWDEDIKGYAPKSPFTVRVFKRKTKV